MQRVSAKSLRSSADWEDVRVFLALARAPSLTGCARLLGVDKATVSRRVAALEKALGGALFHRRPDGLHVSPLGERLRGYAETMEQSARALEQEAEREREAPLGQVRLATTEAMGAHLVDAGLMDLCRELPGLQLDILTGNRPLDLERHEADLAIRLVRPTQPSLKVRAPLRFTFALYAARAYLRGRGTPRTVSQLAGHDVLVPSGELEALPEGRWLASVPQVRVALRSSSLPVLVAAAVRGHGLVALTRAWGDHHQGLEPVMPLTGVPARPLWLVMHAEAAQREAVRRVADRVAVLLKAGLARPRA